jgi:asparagine synthase (glutamine-hydrolysing)
MCGLAGVFSTTLGPELTRKSLEEMLQVQHHRGPDSSGIWCGTVSGTYSCLGLNRLKILDLSDDANQPMVSKDGRFILVFNGEIYNYVELRAELAASGAVFRTQSDTEVVLEALIKWGTAAFTRFNGMWALAFLNRNTGDVTLSRDRFGIKPLYIYLNERGLFISSEIKAILRSARDKFKVSPSVANAFLQQNLLCASANTFFAGINEFPAGYWAKITLSKLEKTSIQSQRYWTIPTCSNHHPAEDELIERIRTTFVDAVKLRLRSDVPVGMLLSGGTDSSAIAAAIHHLDPTRDDIKLISAVAGNGNDEQPFIDLMANHLKRNVEKVVLDYSASKALELISEVSWFNDEPIGSFSTVAHYLLMNQARDLGVTVLLSGQGADESLCGYKKYLGFYVQELLSSGHWLKAAHTVGKFIANDTVLSQIDYREMKRYLPQWLRLPEIDIRGSTLLEFNERIRVGLNGGGVVGRQVIDIERLSVPALVHYEDRMSMAAAREIRLPFLDYRLVSLLVPLPVDYKLRDGWTKWIFRRAMETLLPKEIAWRKDKQHFIVPQNNWFRRELRGELLKLLEGEWITEHLGLIDPRKFRARYDAYLRHATGNVRLGFKDIFSPIALELWARRFEKDLSP